MFRAKADQIRDHALRVVFSALLCTGCINACFAQAPPLDVPRASVLPPPSSGCDPGLSGTTGLYGNISPTTNLSAVGNVGAAVNLSPIGTVSPASNVSSGSNSMLTGTLPLYSTDINGNYPLYSTPDLGGIFPLNSVPTPGVNAPLYSNPNLGTNYGLANTLTPAVNPGILKCHSGIPVDGWLLYPSIRIYALYSNNLFFTPTSQTNVWGIGASPSLTAQWTNGIHTTTIYANVDSQDYPTDNPINTFDRQATFTQKYAPLPDLTFTGAFDYTHKTISSALINSIPTGVTTLPATPILLPDGDIELPNGDIVSPTGQIVGHAPVLANSGITAVDPYDQYTGTATVSKIFNGAILTLSSLLQNRYYQLTQGGTGPSSFNSFRSESFFENGSVALGPVFYLYSEGSYSLNTDNARVDTNSTNAYRIEGGFGTRQIGLFRGSLYFGYQGSNTEGSGTAGGNLYGGRLSYYPTLAWTITVGVDQITNMSSQKAVSNQALPLPPNTPVQIPLSSSTQIVTPLLQTEYQISPHWALLGDANYSRIEYIGSTRLDNAWLADLRLNYEMWRNMTLSWEYQFTSVVSNAVGASAARNLVMMSANYRF